MVTCCDHDLQAQPIARIAARRKLLPHFAFACIVVSPSPQ